MNWFRYRKYKKKKKEHKKYLLSFYRKKIEKIIEGDLISHKIVNYKHNSYLYEEVPENEYIPTNKINRSVLISFNIDNNIFNLNINQKYVEKTPSTRFDKNYYFYYTLKLDDVQIYLGQDYISELFIELYNYEFNTKVKNLNIKLNKI